MRSWFKIKKKMSDFIWIESSILLWQISKFGLKDRKRRFELEFFLCVFGLQEP
jgi:hypothetical protein